MEEDSPEQPRQMFSSGSRIKTPQPRPVKELKLKVTQLVAPTADTKASSDRNLVINTSEKPDVHLRGDLVKHAEMIRIQSATRMGKSSRVPMVLDDESPTSPGKFNFEEMVRIGRPDRDNTLRVPLMRSLQSLRKYKMGTSPSLKTGMLRRSLESSAPDEQTKLLLAELSARGRPGSPLLASPAPPPGKLAEMSFTDEATEPSNSLAHAKSAPDVLRLTKPGEKNITIKPGSNPNLHLFHLSAQGKRDVKSSGGNREGMGSTTRRHGTGEGERVRDGADPIGTAADDGEIVQEQSFPALYNPSTVRLPRMEIVPGKILVI